MIKSFRHKGLESFFLHGSKAGIQARHAAKLKILLTALNAAESPEDLQAPSWRLHALKGELGGYWALNVNGNWRITFRFEETDVILLDYQDYH